jgi:hypothetical protein
MGPDEALYVDNALFHQLPWMVDLHIMVRPSLEALQAHCHDWEPHIFHFVGHGGMSNGQPYLQCYEGEQAQGKQLIPSNLISLFGRTVPRLVVLNACRSGQGQVPPNASANLEAANATYNFSQRLINKGVPAVIAMQADIIGKDAVALMCRFYSQLAQGYAIDRALYMARHQSYTRDPDLQSNWSWTIPTLCLASNARVEDVLILDTDEQHRDGLCVLPSLCVLDKYDTIPLAMSVKIHIGREEDERQLTKKVLEPGAAPITLIRGVEDVGKSTVLYWLAESCAHRGINFIYADFGRKALDYWDVLRLIRDGHLETDKKVEGIVLKNKLQPDQIFNLFNYTLNCKCIPNYKTDNPQKPDLTREISDETRTLNIEEALVELHTVGEGEDVVKTITDAFIEGLCQAATPNGLVIFLDHIDKIPRFTLDKMQKYLIGKLPQRADNCIRLVLAVQDPDPFRRQSISELSCEDVLQIMERNGQEIFVQPFYGFTDEQARWFARMWARRYFISCKHDKFMRIKEEMFRNRPHQRVQLLPNDVDVDSYVERHIHYGNLPVLPKRFIGDLLDEDRLRDWLYDIQGKV